MMLKTRVIIPLITVLCIFLMVSCGKAPIEPADGHDAFELTDIGDEWKAQLTATLSKLETQGTFDEHFMDGYAMALFDLNFDGVPEVIEVEAGGSSGAVNYIAYDMYEGNAVVTFSGGVFHDEHSDAWCIYFDTETDSYKMIGNFTTHSGNTVLKRHIRELVFDAELNSYSEKSLFCAEYEIEEKALDGEPAEERAAVAHYYLDGNVSAFEYNYQYDLFVSSFVRIPNTGMKLVRWADIDNNDNGAKAIENMAEALLNSGQKYVKAAN